jgi:hypothetical protein
MKPGTARKAFAYEVNSFSLPPDEIKDGLLKSRRDLEREFTAVRKVYFPRWDRARRWRCRFHSAAMAGVGCEGLCDCERKIIYIPNNTEDLIAALIHEICHAVTPSTTHGRPWQERMLKAASVADRTRQSRLAEFLRKEVVSYQRDAEVITRKGIYYEIEECVSDLKRIPSFRTVVKRVAQRNVMTVEQFLKRLPRAKAVYDRAVTFKRGFARSSGNWS